MIQKAGFGIAFHAKNILKIMTKHHINYSPISSIGYILSLPIENFHSFSTHLNNFCIENNIKKFITISEIFNYNNNN